MQEAFEKIIEKLEERTSFISDCKKYGNKDSEQQKNSYSTMMMYEVADLVDDLVEIVKQEAEQYSTKNCSECSRRKFYQIGYAEGKKYSGWIPCSERLPEDGETYLVTNAESFGQRHIYKGWYDVEHKIWHMEGNYEIKMNVVAWQPLPQQYQPKGE